MDLGTACKKLHRDCVLAITDPGTQRIPFKTTIIYLIIMSLSLKSTILWTSTLCTKTLEGVRTAVSGLPAEQAGVLQYLGNCLYCINEDIVRAR